MTDSLNDVIAERLRHFRRVRGWTLDQLAARCNGELSSVAIGNLERETIKSRNRRKVTVQELLVLARALELGSPLELVLANHPEVELFSGLLIGRDDAAAWLVGEGNRPSIVLRRLRQHRGLIGRWRSARQLASDYADDPSNAGAVETARRDMHVTEMNLALVRVAMEDANEALPPLPTDLQLVRARMEQVRAGQVPEATESGVI